MSTSRRSIISAIIGVAGSTGLGFLLGGPPGALIGAGAFGVPAAFVSGLSQCCYRTTRRRYTGKVIPVVAAGVTSFTTGIVAARAVDIAMKLPSHCNGPNTDLCLSTLADFSLYFAVPISITAVALGNGIADHYYGKTPRPEFKELAPISVKREIGEGALTGFIAGGLAQLSVGFKEGPIGGLLGGIFDKSLSCYLQKNGVSKLPAEVIAFATTVLVDMGGLHHFGSNYGAPIPYKSSENMTEHHLVFYSMLLLGMVNLPSTYNKLGFFKQGAAENKENAENALRRQNFLT